MVGIALAIPGLDGRQAVLYHSSKVNPALGRNFEALDPLEWLARLSDHIPDPRQHRTIAYGHYANRARGARRKADEAEHHPDHQRRRCSPSWARLIAKVYEVDPLTCARCGKQMKLVSFITDQLAVKRILDHLGFSPPERPRPPPREITTVPVDDEGRELVAP